MQDMHDIVDNIFNSDEPDGLEEEIEELLAIRENNLEAIQDKLHSIEDLVDDMRVFLSNCDTVHDLRMKMAKIKYKRKIRRMLETVDAGDHRR